MLRGDVRGTHERTRDTYGSMASINLAYTVGKFPATVKVRDNDRDGVPNKDDDCPYTPRGEAVNSVGCPLDSDNDGVIDSLDKCPGTPAGVRVDSTGCPRDSDGDGVTDDLDQCPNSPAGAVVNAKGCEQITETVRVQLLVEFATNKSDVRSQYRNEIARVGEFMQRYPSAQAVIEGHTDSRSDDDYNQQLSAARANAVRAYIISKFGIAANRLSAVGYGESRPIADNDTNAGRQRNRRVIAEIKHNVTRYK